MGIMNFFNLKRNDPYEEDEDDYKTVADTASEEQPSQQRPAERKPSGALQMKVVRPKRLNEAPEIAEYLKAGHTVVLNLDNISDEDARRMIDYIAGVSYAINGKIERPADRTFLVTPAGVSVDSDGQRNF
jgi:cell division inhibitor SepF